MENSKMESKKLINQVNELYQKALEETIELLKNCSTGKYIAIPDWQDCFQTVTGDDVPISVWAVGLNDQDHICLKAFVNNVGYGFDDEDFPEGWVDMEKKGMCSSSYPELYRFVSDNIDSATSKEDADKVKWT